jgi:hypothetical protein
VRSSSAQLRELMRKSPAELRPNTGPPVPEAELERWQGRRLWAAMMLALEVDTWESIVRGLEVRVGNLDAVVLQRALRGARLPDPERYLLITPAMLDAIAEAGAFE